MLGSIRCLVIGFRSCVGADNLRFVDILKEVLQDDQIGIYQKAVHGRVHSVTAMLLVLAYFPLAAGLHVGVVGVFEGRCLKGLERGK